MPAASGIRLGQGYTVFQSVQALWALSIFFTLYAVYCKTSISLPVVSTSYKTGPNVALVVCMLRSGIQMRNIKQILFSIACAGLACVANAAPSITVQFDNPIFGKLGYDVVQIHFQQDGSQKSEWVAAGRFQGVGSEVVGVPETIFVDGLSSLYMYCYDVYQSINHGQTLAYTIEFDGETVRTRNFLWAVNSVMNNGLTYGTEGYDPFAWLRPVDGFQGAAIQLGIWESLYETSGNPLSLASGAFWANGIESGSQQSAKTQEYLTQFFNAVDNTQALPDTDVIVFRNGTYQDMITADPIPEPGTLALLGAALVGWGLARRKSAPTV